MLFKTISIIGLGYIGLPTAAIFASKEKKVIGVDTNHDINNIINSGKIHINEPGLESLVKKSVINGFLKATKTTEPADVFLITVPTPFKSIDSNNLIPEPDLSYIKSAAESIAKVLKKNNLVILESTSPVGTTEKMSEWLAELRPDLTFPHEHAEESDIRVAYCPERVLPGQICKELIENDRIIGGMTNKCSQAAIEVYKTFVVGNCFITDTKTAEMVKLTENSFRDVNIAFANELSIISDKIDINIWELISLANRHPRVNILKPGPGVGGHCIAVDPWFIISKNKKESRLIHAARHVNDYKPQWVLEKIKIEVSKFLSDKKDKAINDLTVSCFGLAFKPNIDDLRESPALHIVKKLTTYNLGKLLVVEPNINVLPSDLKSKAKLVSIDIALKCSDICILLVDHDEFKNINKDIIDKLNVIDTKGIW